MPKALAKVDGYAALLNKVRKTLIEGQQRIEAERMRTYWETGHVIRVDILQHKDRARYGGEVLRNLADDLNVDLSLLQRCVKFAKAYPRLPISAGLNSSGVIIGNSSLSPIIKSVYRWKRLPLRTTGRLKNSPHGLKKTSRFYRRMTNPSLN